MARVSSRFWLWRLPASVAVLATIGFAGGFWTALQGSLGKPLGKEPPAPRAAAPQAERKGQNLLLVLGDSLARGTGDESGRGFAGDVLDGLRRRRPVQAANLAVNGAESDEVRELVGNANVRSLAAGASWILLSVGGNDLSHAAPRADASREASIESVSRARERYAANLRAIFGTLREAAPAVPIRVLGLYDPFVEGAAGSRLGESVILGWNAVIQETALSFPDVVVVPAFDLFEHRPDRLALDHFHPNRAGYALIAARFLQVLE